MDKKWRYKELEELGRVRLSDNFYMREFLHSEIAQIHGLVNAPNDADLAIASGKALCENILEPLQTAWGKVHVRSGYRSEAVNQLGNEKKFNCSNNINNYAAHIWDVRDSNGHSGATACIVIPKYQSYYEETGDWVSLAWWLHLNIEAYSEICFFKNQCAFNIRWHEQTERPKTIKTFVPDPYTSDKKPLVSKDVISPAYDQNTIAKHAEKAKQVLTR